MKRFIAAFVAVFLFASATNAGADSLSYATVVGSTWPGTMPASQKLVIVGDSIAMGVGSTVGCAGFGPHLPETPPGGDCFADRVATALGFAQEQDLGISGSTLTHTGSTTRMQWIDVYNNNLVGTLSANVASGTHTVAISLTSGTMPANQAIIVGTGASAEVVQVAAGSTTTSITATFGGSHSAGDPIISGTYLAGAAGANSWFIFQLGTNDVSAGASLTTFIANYKTIINAVVAAGTPLSHIIINGTPFNTVEAPEQITAFSSASMNAANAIGVRYADMYSAMIPPGAVFDPSTAAWPYLYDGTHPNASGYALMATADENATNVTSLDYQSMQITQALITSISTVGTPLNTRFMPVVRDKNGDFTANVVNAGWGVFGNIPASENAGENLVVDRAATACPTYDGGATNAAMVHFCQADTLAGLSLIDSWGAQSQIDGRRADGTKASPSAVLSGETIFGFSADVWDGSAYRNNAAQQAFIAAENIDASHRGTCIRWDVTPTASTTLTTGKAMLCGSGLAIGYGSTPASYLLDVNGAVRLGGNINFTAGGVLQETASQSAIFGPTTTGNVYIGNSDASKLVTFGFSGATPAVNLNGGSLASSAWTVNKGLCTDSGSALSTTCTGASASFFSVQAASDGTHSSYVGPTYTVAGAAVASTLHTVIGTCAFSASTSCTPTSFSGAAVFASATSYSCSASGGAGTFAQTGALSVGSQSTTGIVITAATSNSQTVTFQCTGT